MFLASRKILFILAAKIFTISGPASSPDVKTNARANDALRTCFSRPRFRILVSFVRITHPRLDTSGTQSVSWQSIGKWSFRHSI